MIQEFYGKHLILRLSKIENQQALSEPELIEKYLKALVKRIGMNILAGPLITQEKDPPENYGYSGVVILYESHIAIHTYSNMCEAFIDIFSCHNFSDSYVDEINTEYFGHYFIKEKTILDRGFHWGQNIQKEKTKWALTR